MDEKTVIPKEEQKPRKKTAMTDFKGILLNGIIFENPILAQTLGMCSALAITTSVINGLSMGIAVTFVLLFSNLVISLIRGFIPEKIRIPSYIVIIAGFVTVVDMITKAFFPSLSQSLGVFIPLIVVNCIILARAERFASKNPILPSVIDGLANGLGYTLALVIVSAIREIIGSGTLLGLQIMPDAFSPALIIILPAGGFLVLGGVIALFQFITDKLGLSKKEGK
jgi:electron transport complex protein RnfE